VNGPAFDPSSKRIGEASWWSRRDFLKLSFATSGAIVAASLVGSTPKRYRVAALGRDAYTGKVLDSIRRIKNTEIVSLSAPRIRPDLLVIGTADLAEARVLNDAANNTTSVLIVSHVCQPIAGLPELAPERLRKGRIVHAAGQKRLVPELISLPEMIQDALCVSSGSLLPMKTDPVRQRRRVFSGWAVWIEPLT
jgi:hypothetical protein